MELAVLNMEIIEELATKPKLLINRHINKVCRCSSTINIISNTNKTIKTDKHKVCIQFCVEVSK
jgi:hypothetical protein